MPNGGKPIPIQITNAEITGEGGAIHGATITGNATIQAPPEGGKPPEISDGIPAHPILLPPGDAPEGSYWLLCYCPNPPPPHWEWIMFTPGDAPPKPQPTPPPTDPPTDGIGIIKPPPADGGWGYFPGYGWVWYPGPGGAGPKGFRG